MRWKNQLTKTPYLVLFIVLISVGVGTASALITITLSGDVIITGALDMTGDKITNLGAPTAPTDAATKGYVDSSSSGASIRDFVNVLDPSVGDGQAIDTSIAIGSDGFPVIAYHNSDLDNLKFVHCADVSCHAIIPSPIVLDATGGAEPSVTIGNDGFPIISYGGNDLEIVHCTSVDCFTFDVPLTIPATNAALDTAIAIGTDGFPVISFFGTNSDLNFVHCTSANCSTQDAVLALDSTDDVGEDSSIAIGSDGFPVISYHKDTSGDLKFVHCTSANCSSFDTPVTIGPYTDAGQETDIAIGTDGFPIISHSNQNNGDILVEHCLNLGCTSHESAILDDETFGDFTSIAIGTDGFPVVSYHDGRIGATALRFVHCTSINCSTADDPIILDNEGSLGTDTSIVITTDGFPIISYYDNGDLDLKIIKVGV